MFARAIRPVACSRAALRPPTTTTTTTIPRPLCAPTAVPSPRPARNASTAAPRKHPIRRVATVLADSPPSPEDEERIPGTGMRVLRSVADVHRWAAQVTTTSTSTTNPDDPGIALVPTMGALHSGHTALIREAAARGHDKIVVSIYVNPAQFGVAEDLHSYPQTWDADCAALRALAPALPATTRLAVFAPSTAVMYPSGAPGQAPESKGSFVTITPVGERLEGRTRPTFFRGVATVCMKLFSMVQPARVFFGQKDVQQTVVVRTMVRDFGLPVDVAVVPTVREPRDGLALSSRNVYLGARRRAVAPVLVRALRAAEAAYRDDGRVRAEEIVPAALRVILDTLEAQMQLPPSEGVMFELDYISLADPDTMEELSVVDPAKGAILSGAIKMLPVHEAQEGEDLGHNNGPPVRLIDNLILPPRIQG